MVSSSSSDDSRKLSFDFPAMCDVGKHTTQPGEVIVEFRRRCGAGDALILLLGVSSGPIWCSLPGPILLFCLPLGLVLDVLVRVLRCFPSWELVVQVWTLVPLGLPRGRPSQPNWVCTSGLVGLWPKSVVSRGSWPSLFWKQNIW